MTYKARRNFTGGMSSLLRLYLNMSGVDLLQVFIHEPTQDVLVPTPLFGSEVFQVALPDKTRDNNDGDDTFLSHRYIINMMKHKVRSTPQLPCKEVF